MKIQRSPGFIHIDFSVAEARAFIEELAHVRGGARLPKIRQVCTELEVSFGLTESAPPKKKRSLSVVRQ
jgi:hypothetical protein